MRTIRIKKEYIGQIGLISLIGLVGFIGFAGSADAAQAPQDQCRSESGGYCVNIAAIAGAAKQAQAIPGLEFLNINRGTPISDIIEKIYILGISLVGLAAFGVFVYGGFQYMFSGDKEPTAAKENMKNAIKGLLLALGSWLILYTISPALITKTDLGLRPLHLIKQTTDTTLWGCGTQNATGSGFTCTTARYNDIAQCNSQCSSDKACVAANQCIGQNVIPPDAGQFACSKSTRYQNRFQKGCLSKKFSSRNEARCPSNASFVLEASQCECALDPSTFQCTGPVRR